MNENSTSFFLGCVEKVNNIVEATFDVFTGVIFQVKTEVLDSFLNVVICTVAGGTVENMGYAVVFEFIVVLGDDVGSQI